MSMPAAGYKENSYKAKAKIKRTSRKLSIFDLGIRE